jgi:hypothetical protein
MMDGQGKSDGLVVPKKATNKAGGLAAEELEGRGLAKRNLGQRDTIRTQGREVVSSALARVRQAARSGKEEKFTALLHHVYAKEALREASYALERDAAPGVDGQTWRAYGEDLEERLQDLSERLKRGAYRGESGATGRHPEGGRKPSAIGGAGGGGQDRAASNRGGLGGHL